MTTCTLGLAVCSGGGSVLICGVCMAVSGLGCDTAPAMIMIRSRSIPAITIFLLVRDGLVGVEGIVEGGGIGAVMGVPQFMQNVAPGGSSFPHLEQNGKTTTVPILQFCVPLQVRFRLGFSIV